MIKMTPITTNSETVPGKDPSSVPEKAESFIFSSEDAILVTGAAGFIGSRVVESLPDRGFC
jgi:hypothetical protein